MNKTNLILFATLIGVIIVLVLTRNGCNSNQAPTRVEINYDSIERVIISKVSLPDTIVQIKEKTVTRWLPGATVRDTIYIDGSTVYVYNDSPIDTAAILTHYLTQAVTYIDTLRDSSLQVVIQDTIFKNSIVGRGFSYKILRPVTINTYKPDRFQLIASFQAGAGMSYTNQLNGLFAGIDLGLKFKSGTYFSVGYMAGSSHFITIRAGQVIRLKR
jgi:hypothetical protein